MSSQDPKQPLLRALPAVQDLLRDPAFADIQAELPRVLVLDAIQREIASARERILAGDVVEIDAIKSKIRTRLERERQLAPVRVINATGVILHTNLGRAPLAAEAAEHVKQVALGYSTLEYDLDKGVRGSRQSHVEALLREALGCEAAIAVNNNAAAVMLTLAALAAGKEVIVSRGELVEIGGSFRVPDILRASGARLVEVGTTNRTHAKDYRKAIGPDTGMILKVHTSNFRVVGFTAETSEADLRAIADEAKVPFVADLGSGMLVDLSANGVTGEPSPKRTLANADVVTFSGDKLLGGPQAGIVAGKTKLVDVIRQHPLARALRIDKLSLAALVATLRLAIDPTRADRIPVLRMIREPGDVVRARAQAIASAVGADGVWVVASEAAFGGGSVPGQAIPSFAVRIAARSGKTINQMEEALRGGQPPVIARVQDGALMLDARTVTDEEVPVLARRVLSVIEKGE